MRVKGDPRLRRFLRRFTLLQESMAIDLALKTRGMLNLFGLVIGRTRPGPCGTTLIRVPFETMAKFPNIPT